MTAPLPSEALELIATEEKILAQVLDSLRAQRAHMAGRFAAEEVRARELTAELVATRRDEEKWQLSSDEAVSHALKTKNQGDVKTLDRLLKKPYFARLVVEETDERGKAKLIEYRIGVAANPDCRIIDWRKAPISKLFYEYREGDEYSEQILDRERTGTVRVRNTIEVVNGALVKLTCRLGEFRRVNGEWTASSGEHRFEGRSYGQLPELLPLITSEQFQTITEDPNTPVLIQGIAGSGKTAVALHRLAWLLHESSAGVNPDQTIVLVLSNALKNYIVRTLAAMQVGEIAVHTFHEWASRTLAPLLTDLRDEPHTLRRPLERPGSSIERVFRSMALLQEIEAAPVVASAEEIPAAIVRALSDPKSLIARDDTKLLTADIIVAAKNRLVETLRNGSIDPAVDGAFLRATQRLVKGVRRKDGSIGALEHIVVDEVQDLSATELACVVGGVAAAKDLTLVGDIAQSIDSASGFPGWDKLRSHWKFGDSISRFISLTVSHRSTLPIMRLADHVQGRTVVTRGRNGKPPIWFKCRTEQLGIESVLRWLGTASERYPGALTAVLCRNADEAKQAYRFLQPTFGPVVRLGDAHTFSFDEGIIVTDVKEAKGLEFTNVLIWNPTAGSYRTGNGAEQNLLYVAVTRAEENLSIVTWQKPSSYLPSITSKLVRGHPIGFDEVEAEPRRANDDE